MRKVSVIVPFYNKWNLVHDRLVEFNSYLPKDRTEIVLVDDGSGVDVSGLISWWKNIEGEHRLLYIRNAHNSGFIASMNRGVSESSGDVVVLLNNDVVVSGNFVDEILDKLEENTRVLIGGEVVSWDAGWNKFGDLIIPYAHGWMIACTRLVWNSLGGFDCRYGKYIYEDVDLSVKAIIMGYNIVALNSQFLRHIGAQTLPYTDEREELTNKNRVIFEDKWKDYFDVIRKRIKHGR